MSRSDEELKLQVAKLQDRDIAQRAAIANYGVDLSKQRKIDLTFWAPDESSAKALAEALARNEFTVAAVLAPLEALGSDRWLVSASLDASVDFMTTKENLVTFLLFADEYGCDYDGWGTAIVEAARPMPDRSTSA